MVVVGGLTWAHVLFLLHIRHVEAPQVHRSHAECELANRPSLPQPIREPGQVTVTVQMVGMEAAGMGRGRGKTVSQREVDRVGQISVPLCPAQCSSGAQRCLSLCTVEL